MWVCLCAVCTQCARKNGCVITIKLDEMWTNQMFNSNWIESLLLWHTAQINRKHIIELEWIGWYGRVLLWLLYSTAQHSIVWRGRHQSAYEAATDSGNSFPSLQFEYLFLSQPAHTHTHINKHIHSLLTCTKFSMFVSLLTEKYFPNYSSFCASTIKWWNERWVGERE